MKQFQKEPIILLSDNQLLELKQVFNRNQPVTYNCSICGKTVKSTLRWMTTFTKPCSSCASKKAIRDKYGVNNAFQLKIVKEKIRKTCKEKYGSEIAAQSDIVKERIKKTCKEKYGTDCVLSSKEIRNKIKTTNLEKYGCTAPIPFGSEKYKKIIEAKYNVSNVSQLESVKLKKEQTSMSNFETKNPFSSKEIKEKIKKTLIEKYGVEHPLQFPDFFKKSKSKFVYENLKFDSSWELAFWIYNKNFLKNNILREPCKFIYVYDDKTFLYYPDFQIGDLFFEIKGDHFFENEKLINPWDRSLDGKMEAKQKCMADHKVNILKYNDLKLALDYVSNKYGSLKYLQTFRR